MQALLGVSTLVSVAVSAVLGVRLLRLALRTGKSPEWTMAAAFLLAGVVGYVAIIVGNPGVSPLPEALRNTVFIGGFTLISIGVVLTYVFTWRVFRPDARWALALVCVAGVVVMTTVLDTSGARSGRTDPGGPLYWVGTFARMGGGLWGTIEAIRYWSLMRRRLALGLAEPAVANRFFLWGLASFGTLVIFVVTAVLIDPGQATMGAGFITSVSTLTTAVAVTQWLAFFPPRRYLAWVAARAAARA